MDISFAALLFPANTAMIKTDGKLRWIVSDDFIYLEK